MNWWKDVPARIAMHFSDFFRLIRGITSLDRVLLREVQPMTWDHMQFSKDRAFLATKQGGLKEPLHASQRRRADTIRLSRCRRLIPSIRRG